MASTGNVEATRAAVGAYTPAPAPPAPPHVDLVEVEATRDGPRLRAVVHLGALAPADVRVHLARRGGAPAAPRRMWSSRSYGNGRYVFEAPLAADGPDADPAAWVVRVDLRADPADRPAPPAPAPLPPGA